MWFYNILGIAIYGILEQLGIYRDGVVIKPCYY